MATILVATGDGLRTIGEDGAAGPVQLSGRSVTFVARAKAELWAILDEAEIWRATDGEWAHVADLDGLRATCLAYTEAWLVGSSEAHLFRLSGDALANVDAFDRVEGRDAWYTPWGGPPDTRSIAEWDENVYVNVHVGGIVRTDDGGATWTPTIDIDADVHQVTTAEGMVLAACAGGLAVSTDRGATWTYRTEGLERRYARGVTVCEDVVLVSASSGPRGGQAAVYRAGLGGGEFERCRAGLPEWFDDNVDSHCLDAPPDGPVAAFGTSDGELYVSTDLGSRWDRVADGFPPIRRVLVMP
jgi:hypothetical protein